MGTSSERCVRVRCDCHCATLEFARTDWEDGDVDYNVCVLDSYYDHNVNGPLGRLRRAFGVLVGKPVYFNDVFMDQGKFDALLRALCDLGNGVGPRERSIS